MHEINMFVLRRGHSLLTQQVTPELQSLPSAVLEPDPEFANNQIILSRSWLSQHGLYMQLMVQLQQVHALASDEA